MINAVSVDNVKNVVCDCGIEKVTAREVDSDGNDRETLLLPGLNVLADILKYIEIDLGYDT